MQYWKNVLIKLFIFDRIHFYIKDDFNLLDNVDLKDNCFEKKTSIQE